MQFPDTEQRKVMSLAQQQASTGYGGVCPCIVPTCVMWVGERSRLLRGCEGLRLQGVFLSRAQEKKYESGFLMDLAGNAFTSGCIMAIILGVLTEMSEITSETSSIVDVDMDSVLALMDQ